MPKARLFSVPDASALENSSRSFGDLQVLAVLVTLCSVWFHRSLCLSALVPVLGLAWRELQSASWVCAILCLPTCASKAAGSCRALRTVLGEGYSELTHHCLPLDLHLTQMEAFLATAQRGLFSMGHPGMLVIWLMCFSGVTFRG